MPQPFDELDIWKSGYSLVLKIYQLTRLFPREECYGLTQQIRRSANSVIANIAESQGRYTYKDKVRVLYQSRGEVVETRSYLRVAQGLGYVNMSICGEIDGLYEGLLRGINSYIKFLKAQEWSSC